MGTIIGLKQRSDDREECIEKLRNDKRRLKQLLDKKESIKCSRLSLSKSRKSSKMKRKSKHNLKNIAVPSASYEKNGTVYNVALLSPLPAPSSTYTKSPSEIISFPNIEPMKSSQSKPMVQIEKHSEYSKWSDIHKYMDNDDGDINDDDEKEFVWNEHTFNHYHAPQQSLSPFPIQCIDEMVKFSKSYSPTPKVQQRASYNIANRFRPYITMKKGKSYDLPPTRAKKHSVRKKRACSSPVKRLKLTNCK